MYVGKIVETGETEEVFSNPRHPYTEALLSSVPRLAADKSARKMNLPGEVPDPANPPPGCFFHTRCKYATEECKAWDQTLSSAAGSNHMSACFRAESLKLSGV